MDYSICLATTGAGLWTSHDGGKSWLLSRCDHPKYPYELCTRAVASTAARPGVVWASIDSEHGEDAVACSADGGETYAFAAVPAPGRQIWALAIDPFQPDTILASSQPPACTAALTAGRPGRRSTPGSPRRPASATPGSRASGTPRYPGRSGWRWRSAACCTAPMAATRGKRSTPRAAGCCSARTRCGPTSGISTCTTLPSGRRPTAARPCSPRRRSASSPRRTAGRPGAVPVIPSTAPTRPRCSTAGACTSTRPRRPPCCAASGGGHRTTARSAASSAARTAG